jgi:hypothetical protein
MNDWKQNRFVLFAVFLYTALYTLFNPKPALRILDLYEKGLIAEAMEDLSL